ncbi:hypothetical protein [Enhygromyxa salina]|uniref:hypothetical protein n=1 Tax=Enhygromyxa salina TaxID=215803 RepID=UPI0011BA8A8E|nr:hypothetical protein [Enhygromyxa salina]
MSSRITQFFALPDELYSWLRAAKNDLNLQFVLENDPGVFEAALLADVEAATFWQFYIADSALEFPIVDPTENPNRWGLVTCDRPEIVDGDTLLLSVISSKSDWRDEERVLHENLAGHKLLAKLRRRFSKNLQGPMWLGTVGKRGPGREFRDLRYSEGAAQWYRDGGKLRQRGVANSKFMIEPSD